MRNASIDTFCLGDYMQYDGSIRINTQINTKNASSQMIGLANQIQKTSDKIASLRSKMNALRDVQIPTQAYKDIESDIVKAEAELQKLIEKQSQMQIEGKDSGAAWDRLNQKIQAAKDYIDYAKTELQELVDTGKAFTLGSDTEQFENLGRQLQYEENHLIQLNARWSEYTAKQESVSQKFNKMRNSAKKAFDAITAGSKKSNASLNMGLKTILKYGFGIRSLYALFNKIRSGIKEGFANFMNYSDSFANSVQGMKNSMSTLSNQFAAAFSPIVQMVIPWLTKLINAISTAITYVAQFIAILGGKSTFTRAKQVQDSYNKSLGGTAAAAKKAYGALAKFDDLDVLQKQEDTSGGAGEAIGDMFEEVPVDSKFKDWLDGILEKLKPMLDYLNELKDIFMEGFWDGLGDWEYRWEIIKDAIASIKDSLIDIWTDPAVLAAADKWIKSVVYLLGSIVGSMASIGLTIAANLLGGIAKYLEQNKERIKKYLVSIFDIWSEVNYILADFFQSFAYVFEAFASEQGQQLTANLIGIFSNAFMGVSEILSKLIRDILNIFIQPFVENKEAFRAALEGFLSVLTKVTGTIKQGIDDTFDKLNEVYDTHFKPFFNSVAQGLSDLTSQFLDFWNGNVQPILDQWAADFDELWTGHIQPLLDNAAEFLGKIADLLKALWENILQPLIDWIIANVLPKVLPVIQAVWNMLVNFVGYIADMVSSIITFLSGLIDFITGVLTGNWELAFQGLQNVVSGFIEFIMSVIEGGLQLISDVITVFIEAAKSNIDIFMEAIKSTFQLGMEFVKNNITNKFNEIKLGFTNFKTNVSTIWTNLWDGLKTKVANIITSVKETLTSFFTWISEKISGILNAISSIGNKVSGVFGGGATGAAVSAIPSTYSAQSIASFTNDLPHLASGSVIRGGNPFMAILGDQRVGQTNIETPLPTMVDAFKQAITEMGGINSGERVPVNININYDNETFMRIAIPDLLSELARQGYDVDVLGAT